MSCNEKYIKRMHDYLDGDISAEDESLLRRHLEDCEDCQKHFHELNRTITLIRSAERMEAPAGFTENVMRKLPTEKKSVKYKRWFKRHPILVAAAIFFLLMIGSLSSTFNQGTDQLVVSTQEELVIDGDTVIVPAGVTVPGDVYVKNGDLLVLGTVDGNVTLFNGELLDSDSQLEGDNLMASAGGVNGDLETIDQTFEWIWYHIKNFFKGLFSF
ncbi:anti-sigma-W factor RsiW [Oceanobacillus sojae]|uniref:anti-sigma-W factor RsiW n=1 Tax=Oceanobacillus sojae TaxID=582851 RepID=UPI0021A6EFFA|nr:anti-sigma-W factor RsiW [Oceanobacillus sojae]MCT1904806.1 anti-sigma-W factor RsiW [Oceanobacillus sojae]